MLAHLVEFSACEVHMMSSHDYCKDDIYVNEVREVLQQAGIVVLFLPPYSPDFNPLEEDSVVQSGDYDELLQVYQGF